MSGTTPPKPVSGIPTVPKATGAQGMYATQGMIAPMNDFVDPSSGLLTPVSFRFLFGLYQAINQINQRLTNAGIP